jgi:OmpA-OmpF porin, OOP family
VKPTRIIASTLALWLLSFALAHGQGETKIKGLITQRTADSMIVQTKDGTDHTVLLTDETKVRTPKGLGLRHQEESWAALIPGLPVSVKGTPNEQGQVTASQIDFSKENLKTATMIQAGMAPTQRQVAAHEQNIAQNKQDIEANQQATSENARKVDERFDALTDYDVKKELAVSFPTGSSTLSAKDKEALTQVANNAKQLKGYLIEVKGFADSSGNPAMNQKLSRDRAQAVTEYLMQNCNVSARHILAPSAMGTSNPVASNESAQGRANNRRVEVKLMVNKAVGTGG